MEGSQQIFRSFLRSWNLCASHQIGRYVWNTVTSIFFAIYFVHALNIETFCCFLPASECRLTTNEPGNWTSDGQAEPRTDVYLEKNPVEVGIDTVRDCQKFHNYLLSKQIPQDWDGGFSTCAMLWNIKANSEWRGKAKCGPWDGTKFLEWQIKPKIL